MSILDKIIERAKSYNKHIVLAEGNEPRTIRAAEMIAKQGIARLTLIGDKEVIEKEGCNLTGVAIIDNKTSDKLDEYANLFY